MLGLGVKTTCGSLRVQALELSSESCCLSCLTRTRISASASRSSANVESSALEGSTPRSSGGVRSA
eukprot:8405606-Alexandrium_andersonii.AAC.1